MFQAPCGSPSVACAERQGSTRPLRPSSAAFALQPVPVTPVLAADDAGIDMARPACVAPADILDFSRIEANKMVLHNASFGLDTVIEAAMEIAGLRAAQRRLQVRGGGGTRKTRGGQGIRGETGENGTGDRGKGEKQGRTGQGTGERGEAEQRSPWG